MQSTSILRAFAVNDCLKCGDVLPGLHCSHLQSPFSCCLLVGLSAFSFVLSSWKAVVLGRYQVTYLAIEEYSNFFTSKILICYCSMFRVVIHL